MNSNSNPSSLLAEQHQPDRIRTESDDRRGHGEPRTRGDRAPTRWTTLAHSDLNQAKMAAPRTTSGGLPQRARALVRHHPQGPVYC